MKLTVRPLTPSRWPDLEALFNAKGARWRAAAGACATAAAARARRCPAG